jgi:5-methylthioadenosine/S-adenosylhomocysteine deaminase
MPDFDLAINNADYLVTCNSKGEVLRNSSIGVRNGKIAEISSATLTGKENLDARGKIIAPGLINTHTHLAMTLLRGWAEGVDLQGFLEKVWAAEGAIMDGPTAELGTKLGALEALLGGTTTTLDMYLFPEATHRGAVSAGLRHVAGPIFFDFPGLDGMEWPARLEFARSWPERLRKIGGPKIPTYLMPHATYTCSPEHLIEIAELAQELDASIHIHISENEKENQDVKERYSKSPTQLLKDGGILNRHCVYGHGVHLSDADLKEMKNTAVAHCPGSNLKLASGIAKIEKYRKNGIVVGLGTDGCSSSNDLDMWIVMRLAGYLVAQTNGPENMAAESIFRMATIEGAAALGMADSIGSLEIGKSADIITIDLNSPHLIPIHDVFAQLVFAAGRSDVNDVFVDGVGVVRDRRSTQLDFEELRAEVINRISTLK